MKYLALAIIFATIVFAVIFRYEYFDYSMRTDRWTGETEYKCYKKNDKWMSRAGCDGY